MSSTFPTPPTFATPIEKDPITGREVFSPLWLQWFVSAAQYFTSLSDASSLSAGDIAALTGPRLLKGVLTDDDLIVDLASKGLVLKDTQVPPHYWRVTVSNAGVLAVTNLGTDLP